MDLIDPADTIHMQVTTNSPPYVQGPKTSHIAWLRQGTLAGIAAIIVAIAIVEAIIKEKN